MRPMSELHKAMMASHDSIPEESTISEPQSLLQYHVEGSVQQSWWCTFKYGLADK